MVVQQNGGVKNVLLWYCILPEIIGLAASVVHQWCMD
jgi:hypothetical protein